jgi:hypothetical protein
VLRINRKEPFDELGQPARRYSNYLTIEPVRRRHKMKLVMLNKPSPQLPACGSLRTRFHVNASYDVPNGIG